MPQMGVSVSEGTITKWLKQEGEEVQSDEPLLEISTDKVDTEVPSPGAGILTQILVQEGETVDVGTKLAVIGGDGAAPTKLAPEHGVDPNQVQGTGRGGRVTKKDILSFIESGAAAQAPTKPEAPPAAPAPPTAAPPPPTPAARPQAEPAVGEQLEPMTAMR